MTPTTPLAPEKWQVGVLFSRSGVTEITETEHFLGTALAIEEINERGGVLDRPIEVTAYDPAGEDAAYRRLARQLLSGGEIGVIFGGSTSASRKAILPIVERYNALLFYPSMYEGFEYSEHVLYSGATLNQNTLALANFLLKTYGRRLMLVGSDYIYPRESNRVMRDLITARGGEVVAEHYVPLQTDSESLKHVIADVARQKPDAVFSTLIGKSAQLFYQLYSEARFDRSKMPIASLTMAETEISTIGFEHCTGHVLAATYLQSLANDQNERFVKSFKRRFGEDHHTSVWSEAAYTQVHLFAAALEKAGTADPEVLSRALLGVSYLAPEGKVSVDPDTRHLWLTPRIGVLNDCGVFDLAWEAAGPVKPDPYLADARLEDAWVTT